MSRILITGATGFVGRPVVRALRAEGHTLSGTTRRADLGRGPEGVPLYHVSDLAEDADWSRIVSGAEIVIHLAARAHVTREQGMESLPAYRAVNVAGSRRLAAAAARAGVRRLVFVSSVKAAGEETFGRPFSEADPPAPHDAYGISKWEAEQALCEVAAETGLECVVLRPPLVYGPHARGNLLALLTACDKRWPLPLRRIANTRSLVSAANLASAVVLAAFHPGAVGGTFYVSDGEDLSTPDLIRRISEALGRKPRLVGVPPGLLLAAGSLTGRRDKVRRLVGSLQVDSSLIRVQLGWHPPQTLDAGLAEMAEWYMARDRPS